MAIKLQLIFQDRVGIVADLSRHIADHNFNIVAMEVVRSQDHALVYLEAENRSDEKETATLLQALSNTPGLLEFSPITTLPQEERELRLRVVLDNITNGVMAVDTRGKLTTINKVACDILARSPEDVLGLDFHHLGLADNALLDSLSGRECADEKKTLVTKSGRFQYFSTCRPIRDASGLIIGAVEIAKDMQEIKMLAKSISEPAQIGFSDISGQNPAINNLIAYAQRIATTDAIVCIRGASGTGKELFARAVHSASGLAGPFVPINCAALPEQLLESELFGYESGSFTGSRREGKPGLFEVAKGGTVFLDEIGDLPLPSQAKILRAIQEQSVRRIGGSREIPIHVRIITATNRNLETLVEDGGFRQDLYYRINVLPIHIPPLLERLDDIPLLADHFLFLLASRLGRPAKNLSSGALGQLASHRWPGNVRELKNVIDRAAILCTNDLIDEHFIVFSHELHLGPAKPAESESLRNQPLKARLDALEKTILEETLKNSRSVRKAALALGLSHTAILNKVRKHGLKLSRPLVVE